MMVDEDIQTKVNTFFFQNTYMYHDYCIIPSILYSLQKVLSHCAQKSYTILNVKAWPLHDHIATTCGVVCNLH